MVDWIEDKVVSIFPAPSHENAKDVMSVIRPEPAVPPTAAKATNEGVLVSPDVSALYDWIGLANESYTVTVKNSGEAWDVTLISKPSVLLL